MGLLNRLTWVIQGRRRLAKKNAYANCNSYISPGSKIDGGNKFYSGTHVNRSSIGRNIYVAGARIGDASIGAFCSVGVGAWLSSHPSHWLSTHPAFYSVRGQSNVTFAIENYFDELGPVKLGNDVWVGARALILDGVSVGDGATIAAGAVVAANVPPYAVVRGVPAKVTRFRFEPTVVAELLERKCWDLDNEKLAKIAPGFLNVSSLTVADVNILRCECEA